MEQKTFLVEGSFKEKGELKKFSKQVQAINQRFAEEKTLALLGSKNKIKRTFIKINSVKEIQGDAKNE